MKSWLMGRSKSQNIYFSSQDLSYDLNMVLISTLTRGNSYGSSTQTRSLQKLQTLHNPRKVYCPFIGPIKETMHPNYSWK